MGGISSETLGLILFIGGGLVSLVNYLRFRGLENDEIAFVSLWGTRVLTSFALIAMAFSLYSVLSLIPGLSEVQEFAQSLLSVSPETLSLDLLIAGAGLTLVTALGHLVHICGMKQEEPLLASVQLDSAKSAVLHTAPTGTSSRGAQYGLKHNIDLEAKARGKNSSTGFFENKGPSSTDSRTSSQQSGDSVSAAPVSPDGTSKDAAASAQTPE